MSPPLQDPQRLRRRRINAGLNQAELAKRAGISPSHMSVLERGVRGASPRVLKKFAEIMKCDVDDLRPPDGATAGGA
ncbi:helix-turn-helix domain-containing protein [Streptomyces sp. enrichment culture]|uniref:helix-turn-helix domain-containing protein n=1 Tax=Streptomyces sp. enrichment culture TaxID=1795815 RepID=UPI003F54CB4B